MTRLCHCGVGSRILLRDVGEALAGSPKRSSCERGSCGARGLFLVGRGVEASAIGVLNTSSEGPAAVGEACRGISAVVLQRTGDLEITGTEGGSDGVISARTEEEAVGEPPGTGRDGVGLTSATSVEGVTVESVGPGDGCEGGRTVDLAEVVR